MGLIIRFLTIALVLVGCTQVVGHYYSFFYLLDELILLALFILILLKTPKYKVNPIQIVLYGLLISVIIINFIVNFYSASAFFIKLIYYIKSLLPFIILPLCSRYLLKKDFVFIYRFLLCIALLSFVEYYILEYVNINSFGTDYPFKLREGSYRAMSTTAHPISLGIICFIGIVIAKECLHIKNKFSYLIFVVALLLSQSRIPQLFLVIYILYVVRNYKLKLIFNKFFYFKRLFIFSIPIVIALLMFLPQYFEATKEGTTTRLITIQKSVLVLKNPIHLILGTGIGSFGTHESVVSNSKVYDIMDFPDHYKSIIVTNKATGVETFLVMLLIELGVIGFVLFYFILFHITSTKLSSLKLFLVLIMIVYTLVYPLYTFPFVFLINIFFPKFNTNQILIKIHEDITNK